MAISLGKGGNVSLSKEEPNLSKVLVGLGWDVRRTSGAAYDLDASVFLVNERDRVRSDSDFIFYNNLHSVDGSVEHLGDNLTGVGEGDDEQVKVDLEKVPPEIQKLVFSVTIHEADARHQNFGQVEGAFIRVVNGDTDREIVRFDLSEYASTETAMLFGELYRRGAEWKFRAVGQGFSGGLGPMARSYGVDTEDRTEETPAPSTLSSSSAGANSNTSANNDAGTSRVVVDGREVMSNGAWITLHAYESPVPPPSYVKLESGYELFAIEVEAYSGPKPGDYLNHFQMHDFTLQMSDHTRLRPASLASAAREPALYNNPLAPDDGIRGWVTFEKPKGEKPKFVVYSRSREILKWAL